MPGPQPTTNDHGSKALRYYADCLRERVEVGDNIGKFLVLDADSGDYEIDVEGIVANRRLRARHPGIDPHRLFAIRIGFDAAYAVGGAITRTSR